MLCSCEQEYHYEVVNLSDAVRILGDSVKSDTCVRLEVRRGYVLKDALREARKPKFNPERSVKVS